MAKGRSPRRRRESTIRGRPGTDVHNRDLRAVTDAALAVEHQAEGIHAGSAGLPDRLAGVQRTLAVTVVYYFSPAAQPRRRSWWEMFQAGAPGGDVAEERKGRRCRCLHRTSRPLRCLSLVRVGGRCSPATCSRARRSHVPVQRACLGCRSGRTRVVEQRSTSGRWSEIEDEPVRNRVRGSRPSSARWRSRTGTAPGATDSCAPTEGAARRPSARSSGNGNREPYGTPLRRSAACTSALTVRVVTAVALRRGGASLRRRREPSAATGREAPNHTRKPDARLRRLPPRRGGDASQVG